MKLSAPKGSKVYIGESTNVLSRLGRHADNLENNRHDCFELQQDFNNYGKTYFVFKVLEINAKLQIEKKRKLTEEKYLKFKNGLILHFKK